MQTDNKTLNEMKDGGERYILILWSLTVLLASLIGDIIILIATIKHGAIKQHKAIVTVMQHMAISDILQTVFRVFPVMLAFITDRWIWGELLCHLTENMTYICGGVTRYLTCTLCTLKLIIVKFPLKTGAWSTRRGHSICTAMWLLELGLYCPTLVVNVFYVRDTIHFSYWLYTCNYDYSSSSLPSWYLPSFSIMFLTFSILSYVTMAVTSLLLLIVAKRAGSRHGENLRWEGVMTVLLTLGVFLVSYIPSMVVIVSSVLGMEHSNTAYRAAIYLTYLNIMSNFFVYSLTLRSFRHFLKTKTSEIIYMVKLPTQQKLRPRQRSRRIEHKETAS